MPCKIPLAEGDDDLRELLLNVTGEQCEIEAVEDAAQAIRALALTDLLPHPQHGHEK
jgi:hypothetical protein